MDYWWTMRALLLAMHKWVKEGVGAAAEPVSAAEGRLAGAGGVDCVSGDPRRAPRRARSMPARAYANPLNPPPAERAPMGWPLPLLVPEVDEDGNERAGIRLPEVAVPLATYTGWNFRKPEIGSPNELVSLLGSSIPFAPTRAAREAAKDPRRSIEERYHRRRTTSRRWSRRPMRS